MNKEKFQELIAAPDRIDPEDIAELQQVVRNYPYFHNAHLLLLYGLYRHNFEKFEEQLKHSAVYLSNRSNLLHFIIYGWPGTSQPQKKNDEIQEVAVQPETELPVVAPAEQENTLTTGKADEETFQPVAAQKPAEEVFTFDDTFSLSADESHTTEFAEQGTDTVEKVSLPSDLLEFDLGTKADDEEDVDLIDTFLKVNPRIVPKLDLEDSRGDISQPYLEEKDDIVTETLADIYEQQGHFLKAKEAYQKLILKFPEKSTYFASRIKELEKRIK